MMGAEMVSAVCSEIYVHSIRFGNVKNRKKMKVIKKFRERREEADKDDSVLTDGTEDTIISLGQKKAFVSYLRQMWPV